MSPATALLGGLVSGLALGWLTAIPWLDRKYEARPPRYTVVPQRDGFRASPERR